MTGHRHFRWWIVALLFLFALINTLDRQTLSVLAPTLQAELGFSSVEYSYAVSAFLAAYTLGYFFSGHLIDRWGVKVALALALGFWSLAAGAHAFVHGWIGLAVCRFALGLGESFNLPGGMKSLAEWTPPSERALSTAIFSSGNAMGAILAPILVSSLALHYGWRGSFFGTALLGIGLLVIWLGTYASPAKPPRLSGAEPESPARSQAAAETRAPPGTPIESSEKIGSLLRHPLCLAFIFSRLLTDPISYFLNFWIPDYLGRGRGFSLALMGVVGWLPYLAGDVGGPGGGAVSDWLVRRGWSSPRARLRLMLVAAGLMPLAAGVTFARADWLALAILAVLCAAQTCWMSNQLALISESFPPHLTGKVIAWSSVGGGIGGALTTLLVGASIKHHGYALVFATMGGLPLLAYLAVSRQVNSPVRWSASLSNPA
jgi:ACS family hexuronate transporter-like MFS transporter